MHINSHLILFFLTDLRFFSAYATGLLCARRALTKLGLADKYEGVAEPDGELTLTEAIDEEDAPVHSSASLMSVSAALPPVPVFSVP